MKNQRPINLDLFTIRFPLTAIVSILHRIAGVILFLGIPFFLWLLQNSLASQETFDHLHEMLTTNFAKWVIWGLLSAYFYHLLAGIKHLLMDLNIGMELKSSRVASLLTLAISILLIVLTGFWLW